MAQAEQADEHDDEQDKVCNRYRHEGCCIAGRVGYVAAAGDRPEPGTPIRADLRMDKYERSGIDQDRSFAHLSDAWHRSWIQFIYRTAGK